MAAPIVNHVRITLLIYSWRSGLLILRIESTSFYVALKFNHRIRLNIFRFLYQERTCRKVTPNEDIIHEAGNNLLFIFRDNT